MFKGPRVRASVGGFVSTRGGLVMAVCLVCGLARGGLEMGRRHVVPRRGGAWCKRGGFGRGKVQPTGHTHLGGRR